MNKDSDLNNKKIDMESARQFHDITNHLRQALSIKERKQNVIKAAVITAASCCFFSPCTVPYMVYQGCKIREEEKKIKESEPLVNQPAFATMS